MAYERVCGPLGPERGDAQAAIVAAAISNAMRAKGSKSFTPAEFMPKWDQPNAGREQTEQDHARMVRGLHRVMGGRTETKTREGVSTGVDVGGSAGEGGR